MHRTLSALSTFLLTLPTVAWGQSPAPGELEVIEHASRPWPAHQCQTFTPEVEAMAAHFRENGLTYEPRDAGPVTLVETQDRGQVFTFYDDTGQFIPSNFNPARSDHFQRLVSAVWQRFYLFHDDVFEFMVFIPNWNIPGLGAFYLPLANDVRGIGYRNNPGPEIYDSTPQLNIEGIVFLNNYRGFLGGFGRLLGHFTFAQELGHRWGVFARFDDGDGDSAAFLGRDDSHWSYFFNSRNSAMEGNRWNEISDGRFRTATDIRDPLFGDFDLYFMGLMPPEEVQPTYLIMDPDVPSNARSVDGGRIRASSTPQFNSPVTVEGSKREITLDHVIEAEGERRPHADDSPKTFRVAFVFLVRQNEVVNNQVLQEVEDLRTFFEESWEFDVGGRADLITNLQGVHGHWGESCSRAQMEPGDCDDAVSDMCAEPTANGGRPFCAKRCEEDADCSRGGFGAQCCETAFLNGEQVKMCSYDFICGTGLATGGSSSGSMGGSSSGEPVDLGPTAGESCDASTTCAPGLTCVGEPGKASGTCRFPCNTDTGGEEGGCPDLHECRELGDGPNGVCFPFEGTDCDDDDDCAAGLTCVGSAGSPTGLCRFNCSPALPDCRAGFECRALGTDGDGVCVPGAGGGGGSGGLCHSAVNPPGTEGTHDPEPPVGLALLGLLLAYFVLRQNRRTA